MIRSMSNQVSPLSPTHNSIEQRLVSFFQDGAKMLGLPKSVGEIFGILYASPAPLTMLDIVERTGISKGSASQGLKMLRTLGAVREVELNNERKTYFQADIELKRIASGFIREEIRPHLESGKMKLDVMSRELNLIEDSHLKDFYEGRIERLERWEKKANLLIPILQRFLGK